MYESIALILTWFLLFLITHVAFKNMRQLCLISCKIVTTTYLWAVIWIATQIHRLPEWEISLKDSVATLMNGTLFRQEL